MSWVRHDDLRGIVDGALEYMDAPAGLVEILRCAVDAVPDREAVVEPGGERITYAHLWDRASRVAGGLRDRGVRPGDRVATDLPNGVAWVVAYWGVHLAGAVVVPVNSRLTDAEKSQQLDQAGCAVVMDDPSALPYGAPIRPAESEPDAVASIFFTSGTTGAPKGVAMSNRNLVTAAENTVRMLASGLPEVTGHRGLISVPLFHVTGCHSQMLSTVLAQGTSVVMPRFDVDSFLHLIAEERIDVVISVPTVYWRAAHHPSAREVDLSTVAAALYGGAPVPPELAPALRELFPGAALINGFGCTESTGVLTALPDELAVSHSGAIGLPMPAVEVELRDVDETGAGELFVRGGSIMVGYWNGEGVDLLEGGWVSTGDIARRDEDGVLWIVDRAKDRISRGGEKVFSIEVENVMIGAPGVFEIAVVGVPDADLGERIGAVVHGEPGASIDPEKIAGYAREHLPTFKRPEYIHVSDEPLPRNAGGKILKPALRVGVDWARAYRPVR